MPTPRISTDPWAAAVRHLSKDPVLRALIKRVGPCTLCPRRDYFVVLSRAIYSQQISTRVAEVLFKRYRALFPAQRPTPRRTLDVLQGDESCYTGIGLSRQKRLYLIDLASHFLDGRIPTRKLAAMTDDQIIESLTAVHGIGRWTAEMFLMFVMNRPDCLPVDDLGLQTAVRDVYQLSERPKSKELFKLAEIWQPHRTVATWYLWRGLELMNREKKA